jgi:PAS domain S-box-containing protein
LYIPLHNNKREDSSMRDKIIINSIATAMVFFFGYVAHTQYFNTKENVINLYSDKQSILASQAAVSLESFIKERIKAIEVLADHPASRDFDQDKFLIEYKRTYEKVKGFAFITFLNIEGIAVYGFPENFPCPSNQLQEIHCRFRKTFDLAKNEKRTTVFSRNVLSDGKVYICLISPIYSLQDKFLGAILGTLDVRVCVSEALKPITSNVKDYAWILNQQGYLLYHPVQEDMLMKNVFESQQPCLTCHQKFEIEKEMLSNSSGATEKVNTKVPKQLIGYASVNLNNTKWVVAISSPFDRVATSIRSQFTNLLFLILFMIITVIISAVLINRANTKRISTQKELENLKVQTALMDEKKEVESRYRILVEQSPDPIFLSDRNKFLMVNQSFVNLFGYDEEIVCQSEFSIMELIDNSHKKRFINEIKSLIKGDKKVSIISIKMNTKSAKKLDVEISLSRLFIGKTVVYQGIIHDVTKTRQLERERARREHLAVIGEMSARIAHEIKNPLASIQTGIQLLESQVAKDKTQKSFYERLRGEIKRVDSILKGLLSYAREEHLSLKKIQITQLINRFSELVKPTLKKHRLNLQMRLANDLPHVKIDEQKIEQVLWNVFLNAIQASAPGKNIILDLNQKNQNVILSISDEGGGISESQIKKVFQPFFSTRTQGSGLGLPISKKIIEKHGGRISVKSEAGKGTTFTIELPIARDKL